MGQRFGHDFSHVRVHTDGRAAESARTVHARAYTVGRDVVFGSGQFAPGTAAGGRLLAHELAHTVQQRGAMAEGAPVAPGSALETAAASAGRAAASGRVVTQPLGSSGLALAREVDGNEGGWVPDLLGDEAKKAEFREVYARLRSKRRPDYPERTQDLARFEVLKEEASRAFKQRKERDIAVKEAEAFAATMGMDDEEVEAEEAAVLKIAERAPDPAFVPGGFTDEMIYGEYEAAKERLDKELAPAKDPRRFKDRFKEAKKKAPIGALLKEDYYRDVWEYGLREGLFAEREYNIVFDELRAPARERAKQERRQAEVRQYNEQIQRFRSFRSQLNLGFIQGALLGRPGVPMFIRGPYISYGVAHTGVETYRGIQSGDPTRVVGATLPLVAGYGFHRIAGIGEPPPYRAPAPARQLGRGRPEEIFDYDVRMAFNADPASVKRMGSNSWAQYVWEMHGGEGIHPMAWKHPGGRVVYVNEARWTGRLSEINQPHELGTPGHVQLPQGTSRTLPDPRSQTVPGEPPPYQGPVTAQSVPAVPAGGRQRAFVATEADAVAAYQANPASVHGSVSSYWHEQVWYLDRGRGAPPVVFRVGRTVFVDAARADAALLAQLGMAMRLP
jgi:sarcosine oxidase delta subunit